MPKLSSGEKWGSRIAKAGATLSILSGLSLAAQDSRPKDTLKADDEKVEQFDSYSSQLSCRHAVREQIADVTPLFGHLTFTKIEDKYVTECTRFRAVPGYLLSKGEPELEKQAWKGEYVKETKFYGPVNKKDEVIEKERDISYGKFPKIIPSNRDPEGTWDKVVRFSSDEKGLFLGGVSFVGSFLTWLNARRTRKKEEKDQRELELDTKEIIKKRNSRKEERGYRIVLDKSELESSKLWLLALRNSDPERFKSYVIALTLKSAGLSFELEKEDYQHWQNLFGKLDDKDLAQLIYELKQEGIEFVEEADDQEREVLKKSVA